MCTFQTHRVGFPRTHGCPLHILSWNSEGTALKVGSEYYSNSCSRSDWGRPADNTNMRVPASARRIWDRVKAQPAACTSPAGRIRECALMVPLLITRQVRKALYKHLVPWSSARPSTVSFTVSFTVFSPSPQPLLVLIPSCIHPSGYTLSTCVHEIDVCNLMLFIPSCSSNEESKVMSQ